MPAAASTATPSARAARGERSARPMGPQAASSALARFISSFDHLKRITVGSGTELNVDAANAAEIASAISSTPVG